MKRKKEKNGISLRTIHVLLVVGAFLLSGLMLYSTFYLSSSFRNLTELSERNTELQNASIALMDASDYLTERVQRFAITGNKQLIEEYFNEAFTLKHREEAIEKISTGSESESAIEDLQKAMEASQQLMNREYYSFRLVIEAKGIEKYPFVLKEFDLSERDKALSSEEKMSRAADIVFDNEYYSQKHIIKENMQRSLDELEKLAQKKYNAALKDVKTRLMIVRIIIILETLAVIFLVWLASHLGISPIMRAVERIKDNKKLAEAGTTEFRYLVRAYNQMYEKYSASIKTLDYKASHDALTGVFNRAGYATILSSIELETTYMLLFDIDNFKGINDTYGHKVGDNVLVKLVGVLRNNFRPDDFICRIGGDEFVVLMQRTPKDQEALIARKIDSINEELEKGRNGLPSVSISVGITHGSDVDKMEELFKKTDVAMYESKQKGKKTYTFYSTNKASDN